MRGSIVWFRQYLYRTHEGGLLTTEIAPLGIVSFQPLLTS